MILWRIKSSEDLHRVNDVSLLLSLFAFLLLDALEVEESALKHEFLAADALVNACII